MSNTRLYYRKKVTQVLNQIDKIEFQTQEGERLEKYEVDHKIGDVIVCNNKIEIAQKILSLVGINAPKGFKYYE